MCDNMACVQFSCLEDICNYTFRDLLLLQQSFAVSQMNESWFSEVLGIQFSTKSHNLSIKCRDSKIVFLTIPYFLVLIVALLVWASHKDKNDKISKNVVFLLDNIPNQNYTYLVMLQSGSSSTSKLIVQLEGKNRSEPHILQHHQQNVMEDCKRTWFLLNTINSLGELICLHMWLDYVGPMPGWFCDEIFVLDVQTGQFWGFQIYERFSPSYGTNYRTFCSKSAPELNHSGLQKIIKHIKELWKEHHIVISLAKNQSLSFVSYFQKVCITALYLIMLLFLLVLNFYFKPFEKEILHDQFYSSGVSYNICVGILISLIPFMITFLASLVFRRINPIFIREEGTNPIKIIIQVFRCCLSRFLSYNIATNSRGTQQNHFIDIDEKRDFLADLEFYPPIELTQGIMLKNILTGKSCLPFQCKYVVYVVITSTITALSYISMLFGSGFNWIISFYFLVTFIIAVIFGITVLESLKIVLIAVYNFLFISRRTNVKGKIDLLMLKEKALTTTKKFSKTIRSKNYKTYKPISTKKLKKMQKNCILEAYTKIFIFDITSSMIILYMLLMFMMVINDELCFYTYTEDSLQDWEIKEISVCYNNCVTILRIEKVYPYKVAVFAALDSSQCNFDSFNNKKINNNYSYLMHRINYKHNLLYNNNENLVFMIIIIDDCFSSFCFGHINKSCVKRTHSAVLLSILIVLFPVVIIFIISCSLYMKYKFLQQNKFYKKVCNCLNMMIIICIGILLFLFNRLNTMIDLLDTKNQNCNNIYKLLMYQSNLSSLWLLTVILLLFKILFIYCKSHRSMCLLLNISLDIATIFQVSVVCLSFLIGFVMILQFVLTSLTENLSEFGNNALNLVINLIMNFPISNILSLISKLKCSLTVIQISLIITYVIFVKFVKFAFLFTIIKLLFMIEISVKHWLKKDLLSYSNYFGKDMEAMTHNDCAVLIQALIYSTFCVNKTLKYLIKKKIKCNNDLLIIIYAILYFEYSKHINTTTKLYPPYHILLRNYNKKRRVAVIKTSIQILALENKINAVIALIDTIC